jgi:elongation factor P
MLSINDLKINTVFLWQKQPFRVLESKHVFVARGASSLQAKIKNLISGNVLSLSFRAADTFEEADISKREIKYLYHHRGEFWFTEIDNPSKRFMIEENIIGSQVRFLKPNSVVRAMEFDEKIVSLEIPVKTEFLVKEAPPGDKSDAAQRGTKMITLENGTEIKAPIFINAGDRIMVNTETGDYTERVSKA